MTIKVVGLGAGGHAKVIIEILRFNPSCQIVGLLDSNSELQGQIILGVPVLGSDELLSQLAQNGVTYFFIGLGGVGDNTPRQHLYEIALKQGLRPVLMIHPQAIVSPSAEIGAGVMIMAGAIVNANAHIGQNVIVNTHAVVEHDCLIGDHVHIATGAILASTVQVGRGAHIGAGAVIRQCISLGEMALIGAGAVVIKDVAPNEIVVGVPAHVITSK